WVSIYTGLLPANHGISYTFDLFDPDRKGLAGIDSSRIRGSTFWDLTGREGLRSVIVQPMLIYPGWPIQGVLVSRSPLDRRQSWIDTVADISTHPVEIRERYAIPEQARSLWGGYPGHRNLASWARLGLEILNNEKRMGLSLLLGESWDLFFMYFPILDIIQHRLWRFHDPADATYPGNTAMSSVIPEYYVAMDRLIGEFQQSAPNAGMIVMSDHGHGRRPVNTVNVNELLRRDGYLSSGNLARKFMANIRNAALGVIEHMGCEEILVQLSARFPSVARSGGSLYAGNPSIPPGSRASLSRFAGIKSYPHGGIQIQKEGLSAGEYTAMRDTIITSLASLTTSEGIPFFEFIGRREDIAPGRYTDTIFPDILFQLRGELGVGWDIYSDISGRAHDHRVASGGHKGEGVFIIHNVDREIGRKIISIIDLAPTVLDYYGIPIRDLNIDGKSIFHQD
ncbi:MAG: alkaline phosphatase family protein, partial [Methanoregulaceae archaeon]|nr:alkaline phosphatase family protein [Methanoregulaceae archaeon]